MPLLQSGSKSFESARDGMSSPLAKRLFAIDGVSGVFFGSDFVTVTKTDDYVWSVLKPEIFAAIMEHFTSGAPFHSLPKSCAAGVEVWDIVDLQVLPLHGSWNGCHAQRGALMSGKAQDQTDWNVTLIRVMSSRGPAVHRPSSPSIRHSHLRR